MWRQMRVGARESGVCIVASSFLSESPRNTNYNESTGKNSLPSFTPFFSGMRSGKERRFASPATIPVLSMPSTSIRSKDLRFFPFNDCSLLQLSTISKSSHSGFHLRRIWLQTRLLVMMMKDLLILVYRSQSSPAIRLAPQAEFLLRNSLAASTQRNYQKILQKYTSFCRRFGYCPFPSSFPTAAHWIADLMSSIRPATAKSYLGAIRALHFLAGIDTSGIDDARIPLILKGGQRVHGGGTKRIRYPLTDDILLRMVREINNDEEGVNLKSAFCVAFAAFLRSGDFTWDTWSPNLHLTHLARKHVTFHPSFITLTLPASKTDQYHVGTEIYLTGNPLSPLCPLKALRVLFDRYPTSPHALYSGDHFSNHSPKPSSFVQCIYCS